MAIRYIEQDRTFWLDTEHTSYIMADIGLSLKLYYPFAKSKIKYRKKN